MSYSSCAVVNTWGIIENCHFKPSNVYASYDSMNTYPPFESLLGAVKSGRVELPSIFCHPNAVREFMLKFLAKIDFPFVLVTSHYDSDMPDGVLAKNESALLLSNRHLVRWYTQNCVVTHPKITCIPIGLDYHTISNANPATGHPWGRLESPLEQDTTVLVLRSQMKPIENRILQCYSTCHMFIGKGHGQDRIDAVNQVPSSLLYLEKGRVPREASWKKQLEFAFVLSPHGNGLDCHRTWEALALGCIPVVKTSPLDHMYSGLPVLIVRAWTDVTSALLQDTIVRFKDLIKPTQLPTKLSLGYWVEHIRNGTDIDT